MNLSMIRIWSRNPKALPPREFWICYDFEGWGVRVFRSERAATRYGRRNALHSTVHVREVVK